MFASVTRSNALYVRPIGQRIDAIESMWRHVGDASCVIMMAFAMLSIMTPGDNYDLSPLARTLLEVIS